MTARLTNLAYCSHPDAVPVVVDGEAVAALCPACDTQLPAAWLTCPHRATISVVCLGEIPGRMLCNGCGVTYWDGDRHELDRFLARRLKGRMDAATPRDAS